MFKNQYCEHGTKIKGWFFHYRCEKCIKEFEEIINEWANSFSEGENEGVEDNHK